MSSAIGETLKKPKLLPDFGNLPGAHKCTIGPFRRKLYLYRTRPICLFAENCTDAHSYLVR